MRYDSSAAGQNAAESRYEERSRMRKCRQTRYKKMLRQGGRLGDVVLLLVASPFFVAAQAQDLGQVPEVQYENGGIKSQYLPYGRRWAIIGSPSTGRGIADVVWAQIKPHTQAAFRDNTGPCWVRPRTAAGHLDGTINAFRINFDRDSERLRLGDRYDLRLEF